MDNDLRIPIYDFNIDGSLRPNFLFHRTWDKVHSRCIEYPFTASQLGQCKILLDVGISKADKTWINWLDNLPLEVFATDFDDFDGKTENIKFIKSDIRNLPFEQNSFDKVFAVSVIEHIGLGDSQTVNGVPDISQNGDIEAIVEIKRVLKPKGELIMTLPFSYRSFIYCNSTRVYSINELEKINEILKLEKIDYYEYQYSNRECLFSEQTFKKEKKNPSILRFLPFKKNKERGADVFFKEPDYLPDHIGLVTWRRIPIEKAKAEHEIHCDGVVCGVWRKL